MWGGGFKKFRSKRDNVNSIPGSESDAEEEAEQETEDREQKSAEQKKFEQQLAEAEPFMVKVPRATLVVTLDQLLLLQDQAHKEKNVALYLAISDMLNGLEKYKDNYAQYRKYSMYIVHNSVGAGDGDPPIIPSSTPTAPHRCTATIHGRRFEAGLRGA